MTPTEFQHVRFAHSGNLQIPIVDLQAATFNRRQDELSLAFELGALCREVGFFYIENHGVPTELLTQVHGEVERFFALPIEEKMAIHIAKSVHHRGYVPCGEESSLGSVFADIKEVFDMARELPLDHPDVIAGKPFHGPNVWPEHRSEFRTKMACLYDGLLDVSSQLSRLMALALELPEDTFIETLNEHMCEMRILKYPPQPQPAHPGQVGCGEHTDYGIVSVLWQIDRPGLQIQRRDGVWIEAPIIPSTFLCVLGDMVARWTNDYWHATRHRVINRTSDVRHSAVFFCDPGHNCIIEPLSNFINEANPPRYAPTTMSAHMARGYDGSFQYRAESNPVRTKSTR